MTTTYTADVKSTPRGRITGTLLENDVVIASFTKQANGAWFVGYGVDVRWNSTARRHRFEDFCDTLSVGEVLEILSARHLRTLTV